MEPIKKSRDMEDRFMTIGELIEDDLEEARAEGRAQMILEMLQDKGFISEKTVDRVLKEKNLSVLKEWNRLAVEVQSVQEFEKAIQ